MELLAKKIPIKVGNKFIIVVNEKAAHALDTYASDRLQLTNRRTKDTISAIVDVTESRDVRDNQIGLYIETWNKLNIKRGDKLIVEIAEKPKSNTYIRAKLDGKELTPEQIDTIIFDIVNDDLSDIEMTYFVSGAYTRGLSDKETVALTKSIVKHGQQLKFKDRVIADKHCIGGVPGNRTTMIVVPIVVQAGIKMPKTSSRAITSPSGTADTMEVFANVTNDAKKLTDIANKIGGFISWGGGVDLAAADDRMIRVRHPLALDPRGMLLASIMAKKFAVSANHVLIDIPLGPEVKVKTRKQAQILRDQFFHIGKLLNMKIQILISDGTQPIGRGIGPILEAIDILKVLKNEPEAPFDLREKSIKMAGIILELCGKAKKGQGRKTAEEILCSGAAYKKLQEIIDAQGRKKTILKPGEFSHHIVAPKAGYIRYISNKFISHIARLAGAPKDSAAGVYLHKKLGEHVHEHEPLYTIYAENKERLKQTIETMKHEIGYEIR